MSTSIQPSAAGLVSPVTRCHTIWQDVNTRLALIPVLFIRVSGKVDFAPAPIAFRFTAMEGVL
jgi:hypothetical protein